MLPNTTTRLNKYISESGICSRRDADRYIEQGNVYINGKRAQVGDRVSRGDEVKVNGQLIEPPEHDDFIFIALNKPVGIVSTTESSEKDNIVRFVGHSHRIFPIGRLDKDSQGLIFLTNNGDLVNKVLRAGNNHEKEYLVTLNRPISDEAVEGMANGVPILGTMTKKKPEGILFGSDQWEEAAIHALGGDIKDNNGKPSLEYFRKLRDKMGINENTQDIGKMMAFAEYYNGLGYRYKNVLSSYVYGGTNLNMPGKYVADNKFDRKKVNRRIGIGALLL
ncbi:MAG: 23S rRNA pseudouridine(2604) synthase RluF, partial [Oceanospirillum sp.]|nr:23S rRNA pseudouridine(2604) synthase RluF [Oceanospirillum sp.]